MIISAAPAPGRAMGIEDPIVRIEGLTKRFPRRTGWRALLRHPRTRELVTVLDSVTFEVRKGEFFGLLGPNGAGKTTLFKTLSTLVLPDAGTASIAGHEVRRDPAAVRRVMAPVVPEERSLKWRLSARQNLELYASLYGLRQRDRDRRVDELLDVVGLQDTGRKMVAEFSSGMRQRLLLARALIARPRVLLLDEPTRSLDPVAARRFRTFLRQEIVGQHGCTVLLATHNAEEALELCDRVGVLHQGRLLAQGPAATLARRCGEGRFRLLLRNPPTGLLLALDDRGVIADVAAAEAADDGWTQVELTIPLGHEGAGTLITQLTAAGVAVALLEPVRVGLADLIERIVEDGVGVSDA